ncbi:hypothetical protein [Paenibacillus sp. Pae108]|uniref:hypothetical protein n=1 Tax=Paenibacillus sp. Pae108 TaxID=2926019 RepID=UPI00211845AF|nr:hypothetical protein [Paenibacillus sp. Pae108]
MNIDEQLEELYNKVEARCPYKVAKHLGIRLFDFNLVDLCGLYQVPPDGRPIIILNDSVDIETQETTCYLLVLHHKSRPGVGISLTKDDILEYELAQRMERKYLKRVAEAFLKLNLSPKTSSEA